jgi:hypothetical protein
LNPREIDDSGLDALDSAKNIAGQFGGDMERRAVPSKERLAERRACDAKGDGVDRRAVARTQTGAHMIGSDSLSECDLLFGQGEQGLRIALTERPRPFEPSQQFETDPSPGERGVDDKRVVATGGLDGGFERLVEKDAKLVEAVARQRHAGGHGVSAAFRREAKIDGAPHRLTKVDAT